MSYLKNSLPLGFLLFLLSSCGHQKEIDELKQQINNVAFEIADKNHEIQQEKKSIDSLVNEIETQYNAIRMVQKSTDSTIKDSPMASAYIREFDKEPIDVLWEYAAAEDQEHVNFLLFAHTVLILYGQYGTNQDIITTVRTSLKNLDTQKKGYISQIRELRQEIPKHEGMINACRAQMTGLENKKAELDIQLTKLINE